MNEREKQLRYGNIGKTLFKLAVPLIVSQLVNVLYNIVDRIFIGKIPDVGLTALSGVGVCFPIIMIISAFAALFGMGGGPLASIKLGEGKKEEASKILNNSFICLVVIGLILMAVVYIFDDQILNIFAATETNMGYAKSYLHIYIIGTVFVLLAFGLNIYITVQGATIISMISVLLGAVLNIALDPLFIFGFEMGVQGAAFATIISQFASAIFIVGYLFSRKSLIKLDFKKMIPNFKIIASILALGVSPFIMQATEAIVQINFNVQVKLYATTPEQADLYLALVVILLSVMQVITLPMMGLTQAGQTLISYNYGAKELPRVKKAFKVMFISALGYSLLMYLLILLFPEFIVTIFNDSPELKEIAPRAMRIFFLGLSIMGAQLACQSSFLALKQPVVSLIMALLRKVILLIPLAIVLPIFVGIDGIFIAEAIADVLAVVITTITFAVMFPKILNKKKIETDS